MRHPRPADWGIGVTVCVAAISTDNEIVAVSDQMLTVEDFGQDDMLIKLDFVFSQWAVMFAGDDITPSLPIIAEAGKNMEQLVGGERGSLDTLENMKNVFKAAIQRQLKQRAADDVLAPFGITMDEFLAKGRKQFTVSMFQSLCERIIATELKCEFLLFGFDNENVPHIIHLTGNGADYVYDKPGFWAIGSGAYSALSMLFFRGQNVLSSLPETFYHACEAKFMAESAIGVGKATFPYVFPPGQEPLKLDPELVFKVRAAWEIGGKPRMPKEILNVIASTLQKSQSAN